MQLKNDIADRGYKCYLFPLEVGSRGHISKRNKMTIINTINIIPLHFSTLMKNASKISLLSSYSIFHAYSQPSWNDPPLLQPWGTAFYLDTTPNCTAVPGRQQLPLRTKSCTIVCVVNLAIYLMKYMCKSLLKTIARNTSDF